MIFTVLLGGGATAGAWACRATLVAETAGSSAILAIEALIGAPWLIVAGTTGDATIVDATSRAPSPLTMSFLHSDMRRSAGKRLRTRGRGYVGTGQVTPT